MPMPEELKAALMKGDEIINSGKPGEAPPPEPGAEKPPGEAVDPDVQIIMDGLNVDAEQAKKLLDAAKTFERTQGMTAAEIVKWCDKSYENFAALDKYANEGIETEESEGEDMSWTPGEAPKAAKKRGRSIWEPLQPGDKGKMGGGMGGAGSAPMM
jgi:hypothetical protein